MRELHGLGVLRRPLLDAATLGICRTLGLRIAALASDTSVWEAATAGNASRGVAAADRRFRNQLQDADRGSDRAHALPTYLDAAPRRALLRAIPHLHVEEHEVEGVAVRKSMDDLWRAAKVCRVASVMRPYLEAI